MMTREEVRAIYDQGPEAMVALIEHPPDLQHPAVSKIVFVEALLPPMEPEFSALRNRRASITCVALPLCTAALSLQTTHDC
jgi:hypothetical protein